MSLLEKGVDLTKYGRILEEIKNGHYITIAEFAEAGDGIEVWDKGEFKLLNDQVTVKEDMVTSTGEWTSSRQLVRNGRELVLMLIPTAGLLPMGETGDQSLARIARKLELVATAEAQYNRGQTPEPMVDVSPAEAKRLTKCAKRVSKMINRTNPPDIVIPDVDGSLRPMRMPSPEMLRQDNAGDDDGYGTYTGRVTDILQSYNLVILDGAHPFVVPEDDFAWLRIGQIIEASHRKKPSNLKYNLATDVKLVQDSLV